MNDWSPCRCGHLGVSHSADGPCTMCHCREFADSGDAA